MAVSETNQALTVQQWSAMVTEKIKTAIGSKLDGDFIAANYPAGFNYDTKEVLYNPGTLSALNALLKQDENGILSLGDSFSALYQNVINNLKYDFSSADNTQINQEQTAQAALVGTIINEYKNCMLDDQPQDYPTVQYIMKRIKEVTGNDYLHLDTRLYPDYAILCNYLSQYANRATITSRLVNQWSTATDKLSAIFNNIKTPSDANGGLKTGASSWNIGWNNIPESAQLLDSLKNGVTVTFTMTAENFSQTSSTLHLDNSFQIVVPFAWILDLSIKQESHYDLSKFAQAGASMTISITYNGVTTVPGVPMPLSADNARGWFASDILSEAAQKSGKDATGYQLNGSEFDPKTLFGTNGQLRRLKTFVISQQPAISIHMSKFDYSQMSSVFTKDSEVDVLLFGRYRIGGHDNHYAVTNYSEDSSTQSLDVTFAPAPLGSVGASNAQTAFVLGGVAECYR